MFLIPPIFLNDDIFIFFRRKYFLIFEMKMWEEWLAVAATSYLWSLNRLGSPKCTSSRSAAFQSNVILMLTLVSWFLNCIFQQSFNIKWECGCLLSDGGLMMIPQECRVAWGRGRKFINNLRTIPLSLHTGKMQCTTILQCMMHCSAPQLQCFLHLIPCQRHHHFISSDSRIWVWHFGCFHLKTIMNWKHKDMTYRSLLLKAVSF